MIWFTRFLPLAAVFLSACLSDPTTPPHPESDSPDLTGARMQWDRSEPEAYAYTVRRYCFCAGGPVYVIANRDSVVSAEADAGSRGFQGGIPDKQAYSIDSLFAEVQSVAGRNFHSRSFSFDATYGFPDSVAIDFELLLADEEYSLVIDGFRVLP